MMKSLFECVMCFGVKQVFYLLAFSDLAELLVMKNSNQNMKILYTYIFSRRGQNYSE